MNNEIALTELQVDQIKEYADKERKKFGVIDVPVSYTHLTLPTIYSV